jgi:hypothetical protein
MSLDCFISLCPRQPPAFHLGVRSRFKGDDVTAQQLVIRSDVLDGHV